MAGSSIANDIEWRRCEPSYRPLRRQRSDAGAGSSEQA